MRYRREIELSAMHPNDRETLERIGKKARNVGTRGKRVGDRVQKFIDRRAVEGEKIVKKRIKDGLITLIDGNPAPKVVKKRRTK